MPSKPIRRRLWSRPPSPRRARRRGVVIGLGGGSSLDVAKLVALLAGGQEELDDVYGVGKAKGRACR